MAIPQTVIDQILDRTDIVDLIGQRVKLKKTGRTYSGCCPFHQEKTPSFHVYRDKGYYHCFGCQANGNAIRFLMDIDNRSFLETLSDLAQRTGIDLPKERNQAQQFTYRKNSTFATSSSATFDPASRVDIQINGSNIPKPYATQHDQPHKAIPSSDIIQTDPLESHRHSDATLAPEPEQQGNLYDLLDQVCLYYQHQLSQSLTAQQYFETRHLTQKTLSEWRLGYAPSDWQHLEKAFPKDIEGLKQLGLVRLSESGRSFSLLRERVIFPIRDPKGRVVGFGGRALDNTIKPKYINSPDSVVFHKNQLLYGLFESDQRKAKQWLMVEGYMDVIALAQAGIQGAVATLGTASNPEHLNALFKRSHQVTLAFDGDQAGQKAAWRTLHIALPLLKDGRELKFFILPSEHDPDSLILRHGVQYFQQLWQQAPLLSDYLFERLTTNVAIHTPEGKGQVMAHLRELTQLLPNGSYKYILQQFFRQRLGFGYSKHTSNSTQPHNVFQHYHRLSHPLLLAAFLLHYPHLFPQFETLRALSQSNPFLHQLLNIFDSQFDHFPPDHQQSRFFALGTCFNLQADLLNALQQIDLSTLDMQSPEHLERHAQSLFMSLQRQLLKQQLQQSKSLQEQLNLRQQLNEVGEQLKTLPLLL